MNSQTSTPKVSRAQVEKNIRSSKIAIPAQEILIAGIDDTVLAGASGVQAVDLESDKNTCVSLVVDETGSMDPYRRAVIESLNFYLDSLKGSGTADAMIVCYWTFNYKTGPRLRVGWTPVKSAPVIDESLYEPDDFTNLYDTGLVALPGQVSYTKDLELGGSSVKNIFFMITDGEDNRSAVGSLDKLYKVARALSDSKKWILALGGFGSRKLGEIADEMGFPTKITTSDRDPKAFRAMMEEFSSSTIRHSQTQVVADPQTAAQNFFSVQNIS